MDKKQNNQQDAIEITLGEQLGTDKADLAGLKIDIRRLTKLNPKVIMAAAYFNQIPKLAGGDWIKNFLNDYYNLALSDDGFRSKQIIQLIQAAKGTATSRGPVKKPGIISRNITNRDWREKAQAEGYEVIED